MEIDIPISRFRDVLTDSIPCKFRRVRVEIDFPYAILGASAEVLIAKAGSSVHHHRLSGLFTDHPDLVDIQLRNLEINTVGRPEGAGQYLF